MVDRFPCYGVRRAAWAARYPGGNWVVWIDGRCVSNSASEAVARALVRSAGVAWEHIDGPCL
jgi:hypothetical protein